MGIVAGAAWFLERNRSRRRLQLAEAQQATERERQRIARDLHDDLGAGLAEVVLLGELARQEKASPGEVKAHVFDMTEKTRHLVAAMDEIVWTVNPRNDTVPNLASYVAGHAQKFVSSTAIHCRLDIMADLPPLPVAAAVRHNLFLAVKEALHNAVKHSGAREVWLRVRWRADEFTLEVQDDGRGFDPVVSLQDGDGLENMQHRLETIGGRAEIQSRPGGGTTVRFILPVREEVKAV
jgi:signal transduction histidine kinase